MQYNSSKAKPKLSKSFFKEEDIFSETTKEELNKESANTYEEPRRQTVVNAVSTFLDE